MFREIFGAIRHHHILALRQDLEGPGQFGRAGSLVMAEGLAVSGHQERAAGSQPESSLRERLGQLAPSCITSLKAT